MAYRRNTVVMIIPKSFSFRHSNKHKPTGFKDKILSGDLKHVIRSTAEMWEHSLRKVIEGRFILSLREWDRIPHRSSDIEFMSTRNIGLQRISMEYDRERHEIARVEIDGKTFSDVDTLARNSGMELSDFVEWFFEQGMTRDRFDGLIIHLSGLRY